jgi:diguanylate cyclase (GGDEF)-like protein
MQLPSPVQLLQPPSTEAALEAMLTQRSVGTVFQPIIRMGSGELFGYEALSRPPPGSQFTGAGDLFEAVARSQVFTRFELMCCESAIQSFLRLDLPGKLFLNLSPAAVIEAHSRLPQALRFLNQSGIDLARIIVELTEIHRTSDLDQLRPALMSLRELGASVAIDDLGQGFSSLWLWSELHPELVKVDMHFVQGVHRDPIKFQFLKSISQIAESCGSRLITEGIEDKADLLVLRDMGIALGQGFVIARPEPQPARTVDPDIVATLRSRGISVFPEQSRVPNSRGITAERLLLKVAPVSPETTSDEALQRFEQTPDVHALAVVQHGLPVGLINRHAFISRYIRPYQKELFGRRPCTMYMDHSPLLMDRQLTIREISEILMRSDQRYLAEGFIITDAGNYAGLGSGQDFIREITSMQIDAARYANPLTMLPGNVPIDEHMERLLEAGVSFAVAYCDLNHFKAFNDAYGYRRGDEMIKLTARTLTVVCDQRCDFIGHIGGDDFILLLQTPDWEAQCARALQVFEDEAMFLFDESDRTRGALVGEDRAGNKLSYPLTSLAIGVVTVGADNYRSHLEVSGAAAIAKKQAKRAGGNALFVERRRAPGDAVKQRTTRIDGEEFEAGE